MQLLRFLNDVITGSINIKHVMIGCYFDTLHSTFVVSEDRMLPGGGKL